MVICNAYQQCNRCIMDTSDPEIVFDNQGVCNHCSNFDEVTSKYWLPNDEGSRRWAKTVAELKAEGKGREYDCIIGLSGGVDSSYLAIKVHESGLRPLVVHVDAGWNSELAMSNIESIVKYCNYDLHTHVVDWEEMRDLHLAYLRAGIANQDVPQDHIFFSSLYHFAIKNKIRHVLSGSNIATESIFPDSWLGDAMDSINLRAVHKRYGVNKLKHYKTISFFEYYIWYPLVKKMSIVNPLNYMDYDKAKALKTLQATVGYKPYARKHGESQFTKIFQNYYLPSKFGFDKRLPHLSSLIVSGQMTRKEALHTLEEPLYDPGELESDSSFFCKKLQIKREMFNELMEAPVHAYSDFPSSQGYYKLLKKIQRVFERILGRRIGFYYK